MKIRKVYDVLQLFKAYVRHSYIERLGYVIHVPIFFYVVRLNSPTLLWMQVDF